MNIPKTAEQLNREAGVAQTPRFDRKGVERHYSKQHDEFIRQQACREVAEKIFTDFYELLEGYHPSYVRSCLFVSKLADLKAKYLEK